MTATSCTTSSFVYLKSFKELFLFRGFRSLSKAFAKLGAFFETAKLFRKFFFKKFFWRRKLNPSGCRSRSLNAVKVRYLDRRRTAASCSVSFQIVISSTSFPLESGCKITHFFASSNFYPHFFFKIFARKFINRCVSGMFYDIFFGMRERKPGGVLNILLRACRCARVWTVWKKAGKVKIPAGWDEKYSGRMEFFIG